MNMNNINKCTYDGTNGFKRQYWKRCLDCFPRDNEGACLNCIGVCHDGHRIDNTLRVGDFYCDCGPSLKCKIRSNPIVFKPIVQPPCHYYPGEPIRPPQSMDQPWMAQAKGSRDIIRPVTRRGAYSAESLSRTLDSEDLYRYDSEGNKVMENGG